MPPARTARRIVTDENAENAAGRVTRAKAAALTDISAADPPKKALTTKSIRAAAGNGTIAGRKRTALGEVTNVAKKDLTTDNSNHDSKKDTLSKTTLSKAVKPVGVQKLARTNSTRTVLGQKPSSNGSSDLKRPASGQGAAGHVTKKRNISTSRPSIEIEDVDDEDDLEAENIPENVTMAKNTSHARVKETKSVAERDAEENKKVLDLALRTGFDLDAEDEDDPLMVAEYVHEIFDYMRELEISTMPNPEYMENQTELEWKMRGILVDWLLEVHTRFRLLPETLFLTVNIIDRFLSCKVVQLDRLQLVGVTAMFIASKYEEVLSPHVTNFVHVADEGFKDTEILSAERFVLATLDYDLSYPNPMNFLRRISKADNYDIQTRTLGKYLLEIGCLDHRFLKFPPSLVAAGAMYLARLVLDRGDWSPTLTKYAGYTEADIQPIFQLMIEYLVAPVTHEAFFRKYASKKFLKASIVLRQWAKKYAPMYIDEGKITASTGSKTPS